jgi:2-polyprenyl-3-methyl-5-hydroxy-6-metoxy-1,4-benzoquinol methylase
MDVDSLGEHYSVDAIQPVERQPVERRSALQKALRGGNFARKQIFSRSLILSWSHRRRFLMARRLLASHAGGQLLDYGCGDGTFLALISDLFPGAIGTDIDSAEIADCRRRFTDLSGISFKTLEEMNEECCHKHFDVVTCFEVLEHCVEAEAAKVLTNLQQLCSPTGIILISVPNEIGPALIVKQFIRMTAGWRSYPDFTNRERYRTTDLLRMVFARSGTRMARPVYSYDNGVVFHGHIGFNWRALQIQVDRVLRITEVKSSPFGWSRGFMSSQIWFVCRPRGDLNKTVH